MTTDESAALLRAIFPRYPDLRGAQPAPADLAEWLRDYRAKAENEQASYEI